MNALTSNEYVLVGFVGFWGLVGVGIHRRRRIRLA